MPRAKPKTDENGDRQARYRGRPIVPVVYFVQAVTMGLIKIGMTVDMSDRLKTLQVGCPDELKLLGVIYDRRALRIEQALHARFNEHHVRGEWFRPDPSLLAYIAQWPEERIAERVRVEVLHALGGPRPKRRSLIIPWPDACAITLTPLQET